MNLVPHLSNLKRSRQGVAAQTTVHLHLRRAIAADPETVKRAGKRPQPSRSTS
jgi:hypothetical protein